MYLTKEIFLERCSKLDKHYWREGSAYRWDYMSHVISMLKIMGAKNICEAGTYYMPLNDESFLIELERQHLVNRDGEIQDLNVVPFSFLDYDDYINGNCFGAFDCFVALQVWEHLENQLEAFNHVCEISKNVILSFPYKWNHGDDRHRGIDDKKIAEWTGGKKPVYETVIHNRKICVWVNE